MAPDGAPRRERVVVVADGPARAQALAQALRTQGHTVTPVHLPADSLEQHVDPDESATLIVAATVDDGLATLLNDLRARRPHLRVLVLEGEAGWGPIPDGLDCDRVSVGIGISQLGAIIAGDRPPVEAPTPRRSGSNRRTASGAASALTTRLTEREVEVLQALMAGQGREEMGAHLSISPHTVRTHLQNIFSKLGCHTQLEAMTIGLRAGLLPDGADDASGNEDVA